jgi:O-antigen/teichoic acid export membrane protein
MSPKTTEKQSAASSPESKWQRFTLGASAAALLAGGLMLSAVHLNSPFEENSDSYLSGMMIKVGVVLGVAWLAAPQLERWGWHRLRGTMLAALLVVLVLWLARPKIGAWAGAIVLGAGAFFSLIGWFRSMFDNSPSRTRSNKS